MGATQKPYRVFLATLLALAGVWIAGCGTSMPDAGGSASRLRPSPILSAQPKTATAPATASLTKEDRYKMERQQMVKLQIADRGVKDEDVLRVMEKLPRHEFVPPEYLDQAYEDHPLPIGYGQTISQPYMVAVMTELLRVNRDSKVLEIGTGSGYQAAILAELVREVYTIEIVEPLCKQARERLERMGYKNVHVKCGDGYYGWEEYAPYDAIIVTCAPDHVPQPLVNQLADGGRMVIPVGPPGGYQVLWLIERHGAEIESERLMGVAFVPLTGGH